jgi:hypothetical protein
MRASLTAAGLCLVLLQTPAGAETAEERGSRVVHEALAALGGDAFLRMGDRVESGRAYSFYGDQLQEFSVAHIYTRYAAPQKGKLAVRERETFGKKEYSSVLFTPEGSWEITFRGARPLPDDRVAAHCESTRRDIFYILHQRINETGLTFRSLGADVVDRQPVEIVEITDAENDSVTVFFHQTTKLPVRQLFKRRNAEYKDFDTEVTLYSKYKDAGGGVMWPLDITRQRNGDKIYQLFAESVAINQNLPDDRFTLPAGVKILPKSK